MANYKQRTEEEEANRLARAAAVAATRNCALGPEEAARERRAKQVK